FATHFPVLLLGPLGGLAADRFSRRRVVLVTQTVSLVQALILAGLTFSGMVTTAHVLVLAALLGVVQAFDLPARNTLFFHMVGRQDLISAISLNSAMFNVSRVIGPSLAGLAVAALGESICFLLNAASFVALIVCLLLMRSAGNAPVNKTGARTEIIEGFRYASKSPELCVLLALSGIMNIAYGPVMALGPFFADGLFGKGSQGLGFLVGAMGAGALVGVLELARHKGISELPRVMQWSAAGMTLGLALFAWAPSFTAALCIIALVGFSVVRHNVSGNSLIQSIVPDQFRGRVTAIYAMVASGMVPIGSLASGWFAERFGPRAVIFGAALLCLVGCGVYRIWMPGIRRWVLTQEEACAA
ncbi:MAG: MFS transporter, partial [Bryobacteraceae bacterium]|nr:MFS transporter [Bryobacteraceae bacterium]